MSETTADDGQSSTDLEINLTKRRFLQASAVTGAAIATGATPALGATTDFGDEDLDYASDYAHDPYVPGSISVETHEGDFAELEYIDDNGNRRSLREDGYVIAERVDADTPHNPVTLAASDFKTEEFTAFPRGAKYDSDGDGDVDADDDEVRVVDSTHWTTDTSGVGTTGASFSVGDGGDGDSLTVTADGFGSGDVAVATFDLSTVASEDYTITSGMSRKFLQLVADVNTLATGALVEFAVVDSGGTEVVATIDPSGDVSTEKVLAAATGASQVGEARVGELESGQAVTLADITQLKIRVKDADADLVAQGINLERSSEWEFGTQEYLDADSNVDTQTVTEPTGSFSITSMSTLGSPFDAAKINGKTLDVEQRASELPEELQHAQLKDLGDAYDYPHELEHVYEFEAVTGYELDVTHDSLEDEGRFPGARYLAVEAATGVSDLESWDDLENVSWTERTDRYGAVGDDVQLLSSVSAADRTVARHRVQLREGEASDVTSSGGAAVAAGSSGGIGIGSIWTIVLGVVAGVGVWKRKAISAIFG